MLTGWPSHPSWNQGKEAPVYSRVLRNNLPTDISGRIVSASHFHETLLSCWLTGFLSPVPSPQFLYPGNWILLAPHPFLNVSLIPECILSVTVRSPSSNIVPCVEQAASKDGGWRCRWEEAAKRMGCGQTSRVRILTLQCCATLGRMSHSVPVSPSYQMKVILRAPASPC